MKILTVVPLSIVALSCLLMAAEKGRGVVSARPDSISASAFSDLFSKLPPDLPVYTAHIYVDNGSPQVALLTSSHQDGWQIRVYSRDATGKLEPHWQSAPLSLEFAVSSATHLRIVIADYMREDADVEFSGCKPHDCPFSYGVLLYSPLRVKAFQAVVHDNKTTLSPELENPENRLIKDYLLRRVQEIKEKAALPDK